MEPYVIKKDGKYEGFCIDIMDALAQRLNFRYEVIESPNNVYGNCMELNNGTVSCDGMVKMLVDQVRNIFSIYFLGLASFYFKMQCKSVTLFPH